MNLIKKLSFVLFALFTMLVSAQTNIYVSQYAGSDSNAGTSWQTAYRTIRAAFLKVGASTGTYNIYVAQGTYIIDGNGNTGAFETEIQLKAGQYVNIYGGFSTPVGTLTPTYNPLAYTSAFDTSDNGASAFRMLDNGNGSLSLKDLTIINARSGGSADGAFITFQRSNGAKFTMDNVKVHEWEGGDGTSGRGFAYVYQSTNTSINIKNSLIERLTNRRGAGQFITTGSGTANLDINIDGTTFRNIRSVGINASLIRLPLNCNDDNGQSSLTINNSNFENIKRGLAAGQAPAVIEASSLPILTITNSKFFGNRGGNGGVVNFGNSGKLVSENNLYQDNHGGQAGGVYFIHDDYACNIPSVEKSLNFIGDTFISNHAGIDGLGGRGGAILIGGDLLGTGEVDKPLYITNSKFFDNFTTAFEGGAVYARTSQEFVVTSSSFCNNISNRWFNGNSAGSGGAIFAAGSGDFKVHGSTFVGNISDQTGGAISTRRQTSIIDQCSYFERNVADNQGGAIWANDPITVSGSLFKLNTANRGGAIFFATANNNSIVNSTFTNNSANNYGGAVYAYNANTLTNNDLLTITGSYFLNNSAGLDGGAINLYYYKANLSGNYLKENSAVNGGAIDTYSIGRTSTLLSSNNYFLDNKSADDGGAVRSDHDITSLNDYFFRNIANSDSDNDGDGGAIRIAKINATITATNTYFYANKAANGGAVRTYGVATFNNNTKFFKNVATQNGGAVYTQDTGLTGDGDAFYFDGSYSNGNTANGSSTTINSSEFYVPVFVKAYLNNSRLQLFPNTTNYPPQASSTGYKLSGVNVISVAVIPPSDPTLSPNTCEPLACPVKQPTPVAPLALSAQGTDVNSGVVGSYTSYTQVPVDVDCNPANTEVALTARSNESVGQNGNILPSPTPELIITYTITEINNITGNTSTSSAKVVSSSNAVRVEDPSDEIDPSSPRDLYKTYYLNVTNDLAPGFSYVYSVTNVQIVGGNSFSFAEGDYSTVIVVDKGINCTVCYNPANTANPGLNTKHGITALQRAGAGNGNWPMLRNSAYTALEAKSKGFVITRMSDPENTINAPVLGMAVFDTDENGGVGCLKIYTTNGWKCFNTPACP